MVQLYQNTDEIWVNFIDLLRIFNSQKKFLSIDSLWGQILASRDKGLNSLAISHSTWITLWIVEVEIFICEASFRFIG